MLHTAVLCRPRRRRAGGLLAATYGDRRARRPPPDTAGQREVLAGRTVGEVCDVLADRLSSTNSVGYAALAVWATAASGHEGLERALCRFDQLDSGPGPRYIVDLAWAVSGLVAARSVVDVEPRLDRIRTRLLDSLVGTRQLFGHVTDPDLTSRYRRHVGCFGDQVYPIQALARLHASADDPVSLAAAEKCAERLCQLQGPAGQWWWHYDARTGGMVEGYPLNTVHQHAMAPMALFDLAEAGGEVDLDAIRRGLGWLVSAPEVSDALILPALDRLWPPATVDRECRPYELGWLLDCWLSGSPRGETGPGSARGATSA